MDEPTNNLSQKGESGIPLGEEMSEDSSVEPQIMVPDELSNVEVSSVSSNQLNNATTNPTDLMEVDLSPDDGSPMSDNVIPISTAEEDKDTVIGTQKKVKRFQTIIDSDSEDEDVFPSEKNRNLLVENVDMKASDELPQKSKKQYTRFRIDSDSDNEDQSQKNKENNSDKENLMAEAELTISSKKISNKISDLIDSESENDDNGHGYNSPAEEIQESVGKKSKKSKPDKKKTGSKRASKDEAMRQIRSETQRLMRESQISLPYHKPKQRSLQEFMNRKKIGPILPEAATMAARLKMSAEIVSKIVEEKEKEAELFYKSSDSEDEDKVESPKMKNTEDKIPQSIDSAKIGVSRKLVLDDSSVPSSQILSNDQVESEKYEEAPERHEECKQGLEPVSTPTKLFDTDFEGNTDLPPACQQKSTSESSDETAGAICMKSSGNFQEPELSQSENVKLNSEESIKTIDSSASTGIAETPKIPIVELAELNEKNLTSPSDKNEFLTEEKIEKSPEEETKILGTPSLLLNVESSQSQKSSTSFKTSCLKPGINVSASKPKLRGSSGMMIDLSDNVKPNKEAVNSFMDRFLTRHSVASKHEEKRPEVSVLHAEITADGLEIVKDVLPYTLISNETVDDPELNKPGAKLVRLKEDLKKKMAMKRAEEWKQREKEMEMDEEKYEEEEIELDEKEGEIMDDEEFDAEESEPEENDIIMKDKKRGHCEFGDDEAEESESEVDLSGDDEEEEEEGNEEDDEEKEEEEEENDCAEVDGSDNQDEKSEADDTGIAPKKKLRRIIQMNEDSSSNEDEELPPVEKVFQRTKTDVDLFDDDDEDEGIVPNQVSSESQDVISSTLVSPFSQSSEIISSNKLELVGKKSPSSIKIPGGSTECPDSTKKETPHQKLYEEESSQVNDEELMALCSGRFAESQINSQTCDNPDLGGLVCTQPTDEPTNTQILNLCSGTFSTQPSTQTIASEIIDETSQDIKLTFDECSQNGMDEEKSTEVGKERTNWPQMKIVSSSDDEDQDQRETDRKKVLTKKKAKRLALSDDEDEGDKDVDEDDDFKDFNSDDEEKFVDYDSEENEIVVPKEYMKKVAANFVDEEAELSESEWGSEDEDEKGLDKLEAEEGDAEEIDEDKMRDQLGKMHARQLLDDDQRDVRMLKEMLFDDGDLHEDGAGRERKFKWRNIDKFGADNVLGPINLDDDDDFNPEDPNDAANELQWRTLRMEREKFLEEKRKAEGAESDLVDGQIIKLGMKVLKKSKSSICSTEQVEVGETKITAPRALSEVVTSPGGSKSIILNKAMKRGSFLARGDQALARLAVLVKQTDTVVLAPKNTRNFVFSHISPSVAGSTGKKMGEEKEEEEGSGAVTSKEIRKRKPSTGITPRSTKKPKIDIDRSTGKKLF